MDNKTELRIKAKSIRKNLDISAISAKAVTLIKQHRFYINSSNIMIFYPTKYEINLLTLIADEKNYYLPKVEGEKLLVCPYNKYCKLEKSSFNIFEPCSNPVRTDILNLVIVPALMADNFGYRLGYGGGFYDRFLSDCAPKTKTLTVIPKELLVNKLPREDFDRKIDEIIVA